MSTNLKRFASYISAKPRKPRLGAIAFVTACQLAAASGAWGVHALLAR